MNRLFPSIIIVLILLNIALSSLIFYYSTQGETFCTFGDFCATVQSSSYGNLFGMPVSLFGIFSFALLFVLYILTLKTTAFEPYFVFSAIIGSLFALYFIFIQLFLLRAFCFSCLIIDVSTLFILLLFLLQKHRGKLL